ncbi:MAG TPA: transcriptional repressor [Tenuifilaceae bacterium]|nr:transcriptional repressor [Tenuifilaceae bacterium]
MNYSDLVEILSEKELKVTPQRLAVLEALTMLKTHPTVEDIKEFVRKKNPNLALGTVYNILDTFYENGIVTKVKTDKDFVRYDMDMHTHHHIYCEECDSIENYYDDELDELLQDYFKKKRIPNFEIKEINLQITGNYIEHKPTKTN